MRSLLAALLCATACLLAGTAQAEPRITIQADTSVEHATITLGEIAAFSEVPADLRQRLAAVSLGAAAPASKHRVLAGSMLRETIARLAPSLRAEIPDRVRVHRAYRDVRAETLRARLEAAIRHRMQWSGDVVELTDWKLPEDFAVPAHHGRLRVHFRPGEDFLGRLSAELEFSDGDAPDAVPVRRSASVEVIVRKPILVTAGKLRRGTVLAEEHLRQEVRDLRRLPRGALTDTGFVLGARLARALPEGTPLLRTHLQAEPLVKRGDVVRVEAAGGGLDLYIEARALEKGGIGERIRLENTQTRRRFRAEVTGPGSARLARAGAAPQVGAR